MPEISEYLKEKIGQVPELPGIYKFYNLDGNIIYIGKSKCLKKRVRSYFAKTPRWEKAKKLVRFIRNVEYIATDTHLEARLLECELIKTVKPCFNSQMKNDQRYVYLQIKACNTYNPLTVIPERQDVSFGPFRSRYTLIDIINSFRNLYPIRKEGTDYLFDYHLLPDALSKEAFAANRDSLLDMFSNPEKLDTFLVKLEEKMAEAASLYKYETASKYRDLISGFQYIKYGINAYQELISQNILLKIPYTEGWKLFYVSGGLIRYIEKFPDPASKDIQKFIRMGEKLAAGNKAPYFPFRESELTEKMQIDFRDILCSEIMAMPENMVLLL